MNLEAVIQSEVNQKEKSKCYILMHIYGIQKNGIDEPICKEGMEMQIQSMSFRHNGGRRKWDEWGNWDEWGKWHLCVYTAMCKTDTC